jgi:hypothetical protein
VTVENAHAVIRIPLDEVHGLRVALGECPCKAPKSNATRVVREGLAADLAKALGKVPTRV